MRLFFSKITVEGTTFLPCSYNRGRFSCFTAGDVKCSHSLVLGDESRSHTPIAKESGNEIVILRSCMEM